MNDGVTRILVAALGGEGGGVLMNWIVAAARASGHVVQATSVPGVAQRTGSTRYYIEVAPKDVPNAVLGLVPMAGRVDVVVSSELVETARVLSAGFVSPERTTVISSTARVFATAEKTPMGDGRYSEENVRRAVEGLAKSHHLLDLTRIANENGTFVSATMFGALSGSGALPWEKSVSSSVLNDERSRAGFEAAAQAVQGSAEQKETEAGLPDDLQSVLRHGADRCTDFQNESYATLFTERAESLIAAADMNDHRSVHAVTEATRRLALWMAYEDVARVADLKTRPERFERISRDVKRTPGQTMTVTEYLKPRMEEIADILPERLGRRLMTYAERGAWLPLLGKGRYIRSNGVIGYYMLRMVAALRRIRPRSLRYVEEQAAIEEWLNLMRKTLGRSPDFAMGLAELPRVLKGYSDTLIRGKRAYAQIMEQLVCPAVETGSEADAARSLTDAINAALADDSHGKLDSLLRSDAARSEISTQKTPAHA